MKTHLIILLQQAKEQPIENKNKSAYIDDPGFRLCLNNPSF
jgi:hypothetical protein